MHSMTGYGKGEYRENGVELTVEIKSVNNRFLDIAVKCPRIFIAYEELVRSLVRESISRGHLDIFISYTDKREKSKSLYVDLAAARSYLDAAAELKAAFPAVEDDVTLSFLLRLPDVTRAEEVAGADETLVEALTCAVKRAAESLKEMRRMEGGRLKKDLLSRMARIAELRDGIAKRAPLVAEEYRKKLTERINEYLSGKTDESRILTEAAVFADKCNIDEELTRQIGRASCRERVSKSV